MPCQNTYKPKVMLAVWSAYHDPKFTTQIQKAKYKVEIKTVRANNGKGSKHIIYLAQKL